MSLSLSKSLSFAWISLVKIEKTSKNSIFSDFVCHFLLFGGVFSKCPFYKKIFLFGRGFFKGQSWLEKTPPGAPTGFLDFFLIFQIFVFNICIYLGNWGVKGAMCKILEILDQNWQRNNLSKLATFDPIFQLPHSVMMIKVWASLFQILHLIQEYLCR